MKKKIIAILLIFIFLLSLVYAQIDEDSIKTLPDNTIKYFFNVKIKEFFKEQSLLFKYKLSKKTENLNDLIQYRIQLAEKRKIEYKKLLEKKEYILAEEAENKRKQTIEKIINYQDKLIDEQIIADLINSHQQYFENMQELNSTEINEKVQLALDHQEELRQRYNIKNKGSDLLFKLITENED